MRYRTSSAESSSLVRFYRQLCFLIKIDPYLNYVITVVLLLHVLTSFLASKGSVLTAIIHGCINSCILNNYVRTYHYLGIHYLEDEIL